LILLILYIKEISKGLGIHLNNTITNKDLVTNFLNLVYEYKPSYFLEIGAFDASTSLKVAKNLPSTKCIAYEANKYNYEYFNDKLQNLPNFSYEHLAISNHNESVSFFIQRQKNKKIIKPVRKNNSLLERTDTAFTYEKINVNCKTLNSLFDKSDSFCLWIDAEGKGFEVLEGATEILKNTKYIFIEVEQKMFWKDQKLDKDIIKYLNNLGFKQLSQDQEYEHQYNILFGK